MHAHYTLTYGHLTFPFFSSIATVHARAPLMLIIDCVGTLGAFLFFLANIPSISSTCDNHVINM